MKDLVERQAVLDLIHENWYASNEFYLKQIEGLPTIDAIPIDYMRSQIDCGKWEEIITRWKEKNECNC